MSVKRTWNWPSTSVLVLAIQNIVMTSCSLFIVLSGGGGIVRVKSGVVQGRRVQDKHFIPFGVGSPHGVGGEDLVATFQDTYYSTSPQSFRSLYMHLDFANNLCSITMLSFRVTAIPGCIN